MHRSLLLVALLVSPVAVGAQEDDDERKPTSRQEILQREREKKAETIEPYEVSSSEKRLLGWEKKKFPQKHEGRRLPSIEGPPGRGLRNRWD